VATSIPDWLPDFVHQQMREEIARAPNNANWIDESGGMTLYGTIGHSATLRPDGSVWINASDQQPGPIVFRWHEAKYKERLGALVLGSKKFPRLKALLPPRPSTAASCGRCKGSGEIQGVQCWECAGLGWVPEEAA